MRPVIFGHQPPVVQSSQVGHDGAAHHDVVEMRDHEIGVGDVYIDSQASHEESRQAADRKQSDEAEGV
jgi:hypothetical protein